MSDDFEPQWCVNSQEAGAGIMLYIVIGVSVFSVMPLFFLGYLLASKLWDVKIFKYPIGFLISGAYGMGLIFVYQQFSVFICMGVIALVWVVFDYVSAHHNIKAMWLFRTIQSLFRWLFSK